MSDYIPNTFPTPNNIVDRIMWLLTDPELRVLIYMTRHILGWTSSMKSHQARISLSRFVDGYTTESGVHFPGCGLSKNAVRDALKSLEQFKIVAEAGKRNNDGTLWKLAFMETNKVDEDGLKKRAEEKAVKNQKRIVKATEAALEKRQETDPETEGVPSDDTPVGGTVSRYTGVPSDDTEGVPSDDTNKHMKPNNKPIKDFPVRDTGEIRVLQKEDIVPDADIPFAKHDPEIDAAAEQEREAQADIAMPELEWEPMEQAVGQVFKAYKGKANNIINMLWGRSKTGKWAAGNLDEPMSHTELLRFGNWHKSSHLAWRDLSTMSAEDLQSHIMQFRVEAKKKQELAAMPEPKGAQGPNDPTAWMAKPVTTDNASANEAKRSA